YASAVQFVIGPEATDAEQNVLINKVRPYSVIIFAVYESPAYLNSTFTKIQQLIARVSEDKKAIVTLFGSAGFLASFHRVPCLLWSMSSSALAQQTISSVIFGGEKISGTLPYSFSHEYCYNDGLEIAHPICFKYTAAEDAEIDGARLYKIDSIVDFAINAGAFPGCQVFFARHGKVFYNKSFGTHTYDGKQKVKNTDLYDLASVTKVVTTLALMSLYDKRKINLDTTLIYYFNDLDKNARGKKVRNSKLNNVRLSELLTHRSGLPEGLPVGLFISPEYALKMMGKQTEHASDTVSQEYQGGENGDHLFVNGIDTSIFNTNGDSLWNYLFSNMKKPEYTVEVAKNMFLRTIVTDSLWQLAKQTWIRPDKGYLYSDLNLYLVMKVVEKAAEMPLDKYLDQVYLALLNLTRMGFNPLKKFKSEEIVPTEQDNYFRKQLIHGYVHDPMAALLGGIGGNAGMFSNAHDLGVLMQLLLNKGRYGGTIYLSEKTVALFTSAQNGTYRGLGFDRKGKPDAKMLAPGASLSTFGHTGFTGTCVWADPENELVFVFLSNRVCPTSSNQKINNYRIRQNIQQVVYDAMIE
ncbi:MAG TPA: serine hydrolase, partial [Bacteroidales bacterium]|nr:serine hydrolase [Bacteroidales bacterium]